MASSAAYYSQYNKATRRRLARLLQLIGFFAAPAGGNHHSTLDRFIARCLQKLMLAAFY